MVSSRRVIVEVMRDGLANNFPMRQICEVMFGFTNVLTLNFLEKSIYSKNTIFRVFYILTNDLYEKKGYLTLKYTKKNILYILSKSNVL